MGQTHDANDNWAQAWIDEQRDRFERAAEKGTRPNLKAGADYASLFSGLGREWLHIFEGWVRAGFTPSSAPLGWAREHEIAWRELDDAERAYRKLETELFAKLASVHTQALDRLEHAVRARTQENRPLQDIRELYDLWIECAEEVYGEVARTDEYATLQGAVGNAAVQLRAKQQKILERALKQFDLPTRAELNSVHRELRALRQRLDGIERGASARAQESASTAKNGPSTNKRRRA